AEPVHRRQVADGVRRVRVLDKLRSRGRARGEVEEERVAGGGRAARGELRRGVVGVREVLPAVRRFTDGDARVPAGYRLELRRVGAADDHVARMSSLDAVDEVLG